MPAPSADPVPGDDAACVRLAFDRGTILVTGASRARLSGVPGLVWDARVGAHRARACDHGALRAALPALGATVLVDEVAATATPAPVPWARVRLRGYQEAALLAWQMAGRRGIVALPTGSGKTRVALAAMARTGLRALCLVPTRVLLEQWHAEIARHHPGEVGAYGDGARAEAPITIATFESAYRHMPRLGNRFHLLVVDEVHHFGTGSRDEALEMAVAGERLGLTATPPRDADALARLSALVGPVVYELSIGDLAGVYLADFESVVLGVDLHPDERAAYEADMRTFRDALARFRSIVPGAGWDDFARNAARTPEGREAIRAFARVRRLLSFTRAKEQIVETLLRRHRNSRTLVFTADNGAAYAIARRHLIMPLTCHIGRRERDLALARFRRGELRALVSARVLNEGLDVPDADVAIVVGGTLGAREHVQRVGRLLRPAPGKRALVYELVARGTIEARQARRRRDGLAASSPAPL